MITSTGFYAPAGFTIEVVPDLKDASYTFRLKHDVSGVYHTTTLWECSPADLRRIVDTITATLPCDHSGAGSQTQPAA